VTPLLESWEQHRKQQQQQQQGGYASGPSSPTLAAPAGKLGASSAFSSFAAGGLAAATAAAAGGPRTSLQLPSALKQQQGLGSSTGGTVGGCRPAAVPPLKLTAGVVGALNADWAAQHKQSEDEEYVTACVVTATTAAGSGFVSSSVSPSKTPASFGFVQQQQQPQRLML
jgi:hypothetical protein